MNFNRSFHYDRNYLSVLTTVRKQADMTIINMKKNGSNDSLLTSSWLPSVHIFDDGLNITGSTTVPCLLCRMVKRNDRLVLSLSQENAVHLRSVGSPLTFTSTVGGKHTDPVKNMSLPTDGRQLLSISFVTSLKSIFAQMYEHRQKRK